MDYISLMMLSLYENDEDNTRCHKAMNGPNYEEYWWAEEVELYTLEKKSIHGILLTAMNTWMLSNPPGNISENASLMILFRSLRLDFL